MIYHRWSWIWNVCLKPILDTTIDKGGWEWRTYGRVFKSNSKHGGRWSGGSTTFVWRRRPHLTSPPLALIALYSLAKYCFSMEMLLLYYYYCYLELNWIAKMSYPTYSFDTFHCTRTNSSLSSQMFSVKLTSISPNPKTLKIDIHHKETNARRNENQNGKNPWTNESNRIWWTTRPSNVVLQDA